MIELIASGLLAAGIMFCALMLYRNELVFKARMKAADICWDERSSEEFRARFKSQSYDSLLYDFRCWTFAQFYPWLKDAA